MSKSEAVPIPRDTEECRRGMRDRDNHLPVDSNPYPMGHPQRAGWFAGWYDVDINSRLGHIFQRHGLTYP